VSGRDLEITGSNFGWWNWFHRQAGIRPMPRPHPGLSRQLALLNPVPGGNIP